VRRSRFIVGLTLIAAAILIIVFTEGDSWTVGAMGLAVLGIAAVAISRRR
jgi:MYXO-CTERM domain-containing protein